jgi:hypothetical protein
MVLARRSTRGMVAILVVSVCSIRVIRTYTRSIKVCLCGYDAGGGRGARYAGWENSNSFLRIEHDVSP